jgi:uncharacterized protein YjbJ (UPF0337 family)
MHEDFSGIVKRQGRLVKEQEGKSQKIEAKAKKAVARAKKARREADLIEDSARKMLQSRVA